MKDKDQDFQLKMKELEIKMMTMNMNNSNIQNSGCFQYNQPTEQVYEKPSDQNSMNNIGMTNYNMM